VSSPTDKTHQAVSIIRFARPRTYTGKHENTYFSIIPATIVKSGVVPFDVSGIERLAPPLIEVGGRLFCPDYHKSNRIVS